MDARGEELNIDHLEQLPHEVLWQTFEFMPPSSLLQLREVSTKLRDSVNSYLDFTLRNPEQVMTLLTTLAPNEASILIAYYRDKNLFGLQQKPFAEMQPEELCCYVFTRRAVDTTEGLAIFLENAFASDYFKSLNPDVQNNLRIMQFFIQYSETMNKTGSSLDSDPLIKLLQERDDAGFLNLSGLNLNFMHLDLLDVEGKDVFLVANTIKNLNPTTFKPVNGNLSYADLSGTKLYQAFFSGLDLTNSHLNNADLRFAQLYGCILTGVNLGNSDLSGASFKKSNLTKANLSNCMLFNTQFTDWLPSSMVGMLKFGFLGGSVTLESTLDGLILISVPKDTTSFSAGNLLDIIIHQLNQIEVQTEADKTKTIQENNRTENVEPYAHEIARNARKEELRDIVINNIRHIIENILTRDNQPDYIKQRELLDGLIKLRHPIFAEKTQYTSFELKDIKVSVMGIFERDRSTSTSSEKALGISNPSKRERQLLQLRDELEKKSKDLKEDRPLFENK